MSAREQLVHQLQCQGAMSEQGARELADALTDEVLLADGQDYPGQLTMLTGLVATLNVVAKHGDLAEVRQVLAEYANDDAQAREKSTATSGDATPELTVYRAEYDFGIPLNTYTTLATAQKHCETEARRKHPDGSALSLDWIPDDEDEPAVWELVASLNGSDEESPTGYCVSVVDVASEYDEGADE